MLVLDRFRPPWTRGAGSTPWHWILDEVGARIVAELTGTERRRLKWSHATSLAWQTHQSSATGSRSTSSSSAWPRNSPPPEDPSASGTASEPPNTFSTRGSYPTAMRCCTVLIHPRRMSCSSSTGRQSPSSAYAIRPSATRPSFHAARSAKRTHSSSSPPRRRHAPRRFATRPPSPGRKSPSPCGVHRARHSRSPPRSGVSVAQRPFAAIVAPSGLGWEHDAALLIFGEGARRVARSSRAAGADLLGLGGHNRPR